MGMSHLYRLLSKRLLHLAINMQYTFWLGGYAFGMFDILAQVNAIVCWGWQEGKVSTGNSLDMTPQDEEHIKANDASVKDMEVSSNFTGYALFSLWVQFRH